MKKPMGANPLLAIPCRGRKTKNILATLFIHNSTQKQLSLVQSFVSLNSTICTDDFPITLLKRMVAI